MGTYLWDTTLAHTQIGTYFQFYNEQRHTTNSAAAHGSRLL